MPSCAEAEAKFQVKKKLKRTATSRPCFRPGDGKDIEEPYE